MKVVAGLMGFATVIVLSIAIGAISQGRGDDPTSSSAEIVMEDLRFAPNQLNARVGVPLSVRLTNRGLERHDLNFPSLHMPGLEGVESIVEPGATRTITLRFDRAGTHTFVCGLPGHAAAGMTGAVFVRP